MYFKIMATHTLKKKKKNYGHTRLSPKYFTSFLTFCFSHHFSGTKVMKYAACHKHKDLTINMTANFLIK